MMTADAIPHTTIEETAAPRLAKPKATVDPLCSTASPIMMTTVAETGPAMRNPRVHRIATVLMSSFHRAATVPTANSAAAATTKSATRTARSIGRRSPS